MSKCTYILSIFLFAFSLTTHASPSSLTYQGRIIKSDGTPLEYNNVSFLFEITNPSGNCVIYREQRNTVNMLSSGGVFDVPIGTGTKLFPANPLFSLLDAFNNSANQDCDGGATYTPAQGDIRLLKVQFHDGTGWKAISPSSEIRSVPYAAFSLSSQKLGTKSESDFVAKSNVPTCPAGTFLSWDGTALSCNGVAGASGGTVTTVTSANSYVTIINNTSTPQLTLNVGTSANTVAAGNDARFSDARTPTGAAGGDLSGTYPNPTVAKIQGTDVTLTTPASGQYLKYNGSAFVNSAIAIADVTSLAANLATYQTTAAFNSAVGSGNCAAHQTAYWNSVSSSFQCQNINVSVAGDVSGTIGAVSVDKIKGVAVGTAAPTNGQVLKYDGTKWAPAADANSGTVTSVTASAPLSVATGTTTPAISISQANTTTSGYLSSTDWNTFNNKQAAGNYILNAGGSPSVQTGLDASKPASPSAGAIYFATDTKVIYQYNSGAWVSIASSSGSGGTITGVTAGTGLSGGGTTGAVTLNVNVGTGNNQIVQLDGSAKLPAVDGSALTNLNPANLSSAVSVAKGGTGQTSYTDGQLLIGNSTGNTLTKATLTAGTGVSIVNGNGSITIATTGAAPTGTASGDLSGSYPNPTVAKLQGYAVDTAAPAANKVLKWDSGTSKWTANFIKLSELTNATGGSAFNVGSCTAAQTMNWSSITDKFECQNIAIANTQVSGLGTASTKAAGTGANEVLLLDGSGRLPASALPSAMAQWQLNGSNTYYNAGNVGIGTNNPTETLAINQADSSSGVVVTNTSSTGVRSPGFTIKNYSGSTYGKPTLMMQSARGTSAAATAIADGDLLGQIIFTGLYTGSSYATGAMIYAEASENWTGSTAGTDLIFSAITSGNVTNTERMRIDGTTGRVGIGASQVNALLQVGPNGSQSSIYSTYVGSYYNAGGQGQYNGNWASSNYWGLGPFSGSADSTIRLGITSDPKGTWNATQALNFVVGGKIGIGSTAVPTQKLQVDGGNVQVTNEASDAAVYTTAYTSGAATQGGTFVGSRARGTKAAPTYVLADDLMGQYLAKDAITTSTSPGMVVYAGENHSATALGDYLTFRTTANGATTSAERVRIQGNGYVGIGTNAPTNLLTLKGASTGAQAFKVLSNGGANERASMMLGDWEMGQDVTMTAAKDLFFFDSATGNVRMTIGTNGWMSLNKNTTTIAPLGIYSATASYMGYEEGDTGVKFFHGVDGSHFWIRPGPTTASSNAFTVSAGGLVGINGNVNTSYNFFVNGSAAGTSAYVNTSDARLKTNIKPIESALDKILKLRGVTFDWKHDVRPELTFPQKNDMGVIAQEVEKVFPQAVDTDKEGYKAVGYTRLIGPLIESTKELAGLCKMNQSQIAKLEALVAKQDREIASLKQQNKDLKEAICEVNPKAKICK